MEKRPRFVHGERETCEREEIATGDSDTEVSGLPLVLGHIGHLLHHPQVELQPSNGNHNKAYTSSARRLTHAGCFICRTGTDPVQSLRKEHGR